MKVLINLQRSDYEFCISDIFLRSQVCKYALLNIQKSSNHISQLVPKLHDWENRLFRV